MCNTHFVVEGGTSDVYQKALVFHFHFVSHFRLQKVSAKMGNDIGFLDNYGVLF